MSKLFSCDFESLIFELTRLILEHFVRRGTALLAGPASRRHWTFKVIN